jgi:hypothetical protein
VAKPTFPAPALAGPADGQEFAASDTVVLQWNPVGPLPADGYYVVNLAYVHNGETWTDDTPWTRQAQWVVSEHAYLLDLSDDCRFRWSVRVMRKTGTDAQGRPTGVPLSPASGERTFIWRRPAGPQPTPTPALLYSYGEPRNPGKAEVHAVYGRNRQGASPALQVLLWRPVGGRAQQ